MATIVLIISFVVAVGLLGYKVFELEKGVTYKFTNLVSGGDRFFVHIFVNVKKWFVHTKSAIIEFVVTHIPHYSWRALLKIESSFKEKYARMKESFRGKFIIKDRGEASSYLRDISKKKEDGVAKDDVIGKM